MDEEQQRRLERSVGIGLENVKRPETFTVKNEGIDITEIPTGKYVIRYSVGWNGNCKFDIECYSDLKDEYIEQIVDQIRKKLQKVRKDRWENEE